MKLKLKLTLILVFALLINGFSQRNPNNNLVGVQQLDSRFNFSIEKRWSDISDAEEYFFYVKNNTADEYKLVIEVDLTLNCYDVTPYKLGYNKAVYLKPNGEFTPKDDYVHIYMITSDREKQKNCLIKEGNTSTLYKSHTWQILSIENLTLKKANEAKEKLQKEALANQKKIDDENKLKEAAAEKKAKEVADKKKLDDENKLKASTAAKDIQKGSEKVVDNTQQSNDNNKTSTQEESKRIKEQEIEDAKAAKRQAEKERIAEAERKRIEEQAANQKRQKEYDAWKTAAQEERNKVDAAAMATSLGLFTLVGGFIYEGMGNVNPDFVYKEPVNKFTPKMFICNNFGFSFSGDPVLFKSDRTTLVGGKPISEKELTGETAYYLNINAESRIGAGNNFYNFYGIIGAKFGLVPTFNGTQFSIFGGGGIDAGIKNVKLFGQYKNNFSDTKGLTSSDVEEYGEANYDISSNEFNYGLKFTFGGKAEDNYRRSHISLGLINKSFSFDGSGLQYYYNPDTNSAQNNENLLIKGYSFEWKKDHTFSFYIRYYEEYNYIGETSRTTAIGSSLSIPASMFEIGFVRSLDFF